MDFFWEMLSLQETLFLLILLGVLHNRTPGDFCAKPPLHPAAKGAIIKL